MKTIFRGAVGALLIAVLTGCLQLTSVEFGEDLVGEWVWVKSVGGIAGMTLTPESTGRTMELRFVTEDRVELWEDGTYTRSAAYTTEPGDARDTFVITYVTPLFGFDSQTGRLSVDTLVLVDPCCDGFEYTYALRR